MTHSVEHHLAVTPETYDAEIRRFVPGYEAMLAELTDALARLRPDAKRVLDLGAGTGALTGHLVTRFPDARFTLLDADADMLARAEKRLQAHRARVELVHGSFFDPLPPCDVAVASLSLHHVHDPDAKRALYRNIHHAIAPGGFLLSADATIPNAPALAKSA
jgi:tRNA (cmo5U34)-methyltransferase